MAHFGVQNFAKIFKESSEKKKMVVFRKRISAKTAVKIMHDHMFDHLSK